MTKGVRFIYASNSTGKITERSIRIPVIHDYFHFKRPVLSLVENNEGEPEKVMIIKATTSVSKEALLKSLRMFQLSRDYINRKGTYVTKYYSWHNNLERVTEEVLRKSKEIEVTPLPTIEEYPTTHSFKYKEDPGHYIFFEFKEGMKSHGGYEFSGTDTSAVKVSGFPETLGIMHQGAILSMKGERKISVYTRNIKKLRFEIGQVLPDQIHHLISKNTGSMKDPYFSSCFNEKNLAHFSRTDQNVNNPLQVKVSYSVLDLSSYLNRTFNGRTARGLFFVNVKEIPSGMTDRRFVLITDLGILAKKANSGERDIFVQSIETGEPVAGAQINVIGLNGLPIFTKKTNSMGHASFPKFYVPSGTLSPMAIVVRNSRDVSYVKV